MSKKSPKSRNSRVNLKLVLLLFIFLISVIYIFIYKNYHDTNDLLETNTPNDHLTIPTRSIELSSGYTEIVNQIGKFAIDYPSDWRIESSGSKNTIPTNPEQADHIQFLSKIPNQKDLNDKYFCVQIWVDTTNIFKLVENGQTIEKLQNNYEVYAMHVIGYPGNPVTYLTTEKHSSVITLPNGKNLEITGQFNCMGGDITKTPPPNDWQFESEEYHKFLHMLKTLRF